MGAQRSPHFSFSSKQLISSYMHLTHSAMKVKASFATFTKEMRLTPNILALALSLLFAAVTNAQLLVNGSFESYTGLPNNVGMWGLVPGWSNAGSLSSHPDYYHLDGSQGGDLPETPVGEVAPYDGRAIMGFIATGLPGSAKRSYLCASLTDELVPGETYIISFSLTNGGVTPASMSGLATSHIGIAFTSTAPVQNLNTPLLLAPQVELTEVVYDREWKRFAFSFTAEDAYAFMTIGVFRPDADITINVMEANSPSIAYYFVDDFKLIEKPDGIQEAETVQRGGSPNDAEPTPVPVAEPQLDPFYVPNAFTPNGDGDNDHFVPVINDITNYTFQIFSRWGELIFSSSEPGEGWDGRTLSGTDVGVGVYVWELRYTQITETGEAQDFSRQGMVNLIR